MLHLFRIYYDSRNSLADKQLTALKNKIKSAWFTLLICSIYTIIFGIGAIIQMMQNPFAYIALAISISLLIPTLLIRKQL